MHFQPVPPVCLFVVHQSSQGVLFVRKCYVVFNSCKHTDSLGRCVLKHSLCTLLTAWKIKSLHVYVFVFQSTCNSQFPRSWIVVVFSLQAWMEIFIFIILNYLKIIIIDYNIF